MNGRANGSWVVLMVLATSLGCSQASSPEATSSETAATPAAADEHGHDHDAMGEHEHGSDEDIAVTLAKLPDGDREAAIGQKLCPVSGEPLGSMGLPVKVAVESRDVFICCEGCRDILEKEPAKYLTKLDGKSESE